MKTTIFTIALASYTFMGCSQNITPSQLPSLVQNSVQVKFPQAKVIEWEKKGSQFEAEFEISGVDHTVLLDASGHVLQHKQDLTEAQLPQEVAVTIKRDFPAHLLEDVEQVEKGGQVYYQVELENNNKDLHKVYAANGVLANIQYWD